MCRSVRASTASGSSQGSQSSSDRVKETGLFQPKCLNEPLWDLPVVKGFVGALSLGKDQRDERISELTGNRILTIAAHQRCTITDCSAGAGVANARIED
jgi:hypothetical protein